MCHGRDDYLLLRRWRLPRMSHHTNCGLNGSRVDFKIRRSFHHLPTNNPLADTAVRSLSAEGEMSALPVAACRSALHDWQPADRTNISEGWWWGGAFCSPPPGAKPSRGFFWGGFWSLPRHRQLTPSARRSTMSTQHQGKKTNNSEEIQQHQLLSSGGCGPEIISIPVSHR